jgi:hypothetical protein
VILIFLWKGSTDQNTLERVVDWARGTWDQTRRSLSVTYQSGREYERRILTVRKESEVCIQLERPSLCRFDQANGINGSRNIKSSKANRDALAIIAGITADKRWSNKANTFGSLCLSLTIHQCLYFTLSSGHRR